MSGNVGSLRAEDLPWARRRASIDLCLTSGFWVAWGFGFRISRVGFRVLWAES